jgi:DNA repair exonuclease SbcCD ATPase subunit
MATEAKEQTWKVKAEDGSVFGPASMATLLAWARDGRLAASHVISSDGKTWTPVASHPELAMNWIAEISPGKFYGPIHRDALDELIRNGTIDADAPQYVRTRSAEDQPARLREHNASLAAQIEALRANFESQATKFEEELEASEKTITELKAQLETRDLEFEAERQDFRAKESKLQAELAKAEKRAETLSAQAQQTEGRGRTRAADAARIAELESKASALKEALEKLRTESAEAGAEARRAFRETDTALQKERADFARFRSEAQASASRLKALEIREESIRKLLQQAAAIMSEAAPANGGGAIEDAEVVNIG